eukprot:jgi/Mesen1/3400/ME000192S02561
MDGDQSPTDEVDETRAAEMMRLLEEESVVLKAMKSKVLSQLHNLQIEEAMLRKMKKDRIAEIENPRAAAARRAGGGTG